QAGKGTEAARKPGKAMQPCIGLRQPRADAQVLGAGAQQLLAERRGGGPVGVLDVGDPLALVEGGVVGATGFLDRVEFGGKGEVFAGGAVVGDRGQQVIQFQHGGALGCRVGSESYTAGRRGCRAAAQSCRPSSCWWSMRRRSPSRARL